MDQVKSRYEDVRCQFYYPSLIGTGWKECGGVGQIFQWLESLLLGSQWIALGSLTATSLKYPIEEIQKQPH